MQECAKTGCVLSLELLQVALTMQQVLDMDLPTLASIWQVSMSNASCDNEQISFMQLTYGSSCVSTGLIRIHVLAG